MTFAALYGRGARQQFEKLVAPPSAKFAYAEIPGGVRVEATWSDGGRMKLDCYPDEVDWQVLQAAGENTGLSRRAHAAAEWFKARGVERYSRSADLDPAAEAVFSRHGDWRDVGGRRVWTL